jgi:hypothetical protein
VVYPELNRNTWQEYPENFVPIIIPHDRGIVRDRPFGGAIKERSMC